MTNLEESMQGMTLCMKGMMLQMQQQVQELTGENRRMHLQVRALTLENQSLSQPAGSTLTTATRPREDVAPWSVSSAAADAVSASKTAGSPAHTAMHA